VNRNRREYERRVNRVVDYIGEHPADELSLERLARIAAFSPYHFHRIFKSVADETLFEFIQRLRIEKGAQALLFLPDRSVLEIALHCGFASAATFARPFKSHFGMSATAWRAGGYAQWREWQKDRKPGKALRKVGKDAPRRDADTVHRMKTKKPVNVQVNGLPSFRVAYMRYVGPYGPHGIPQLWERLRKWMDAHGLESADSVSLGVAYDNPNVAAADTCRYDACVVVPADFVPDKHVNVTDTASGRYAVCAFTGTAAEISEAWERTFGAWLPDSGYEPDDKPCIEIYRGDPRADPRSGVFRCELCLPVRPL